MVTTTPTSSVLSVRVSADERAMLEAAAAQTRTTLGDFMRRRAIEAAEIEVLGRSTITIPAADWDAFEAWIARPAEDVAGLKRLARVKPIWSG